MNHIIKFKAAQKPKVIAKLSTLELFIGFLAFILIKKTIQRSVSA